MSVTFAETITAAGVQYTSNKTLSPSDEVVTIGTCSVSNGTTDKVWSFGGVDVSQTVAVWFKSDQAVTLETNATDATGGNTISLTANVPYVWYTGKGDSNALTQDIDSTIYVTNASGATATVQGVVVQDSTP